MINRDTIGFRPYGTTDRSACLTVFDANCPVYFAPNEREDYERFLDAGPIGYEVCLVDGQIAGAFGLLGDRGQGKSLNWILISPDFQGIGVGTAIMDRVISSGRESGVCFLSIAASQKSAPFFARFGAVTVAVRPDDWGPGMHRVDMELGL